MITVIFVSGDNFNYFLDHMGDFGPDAENVGFSEFDSTSTHYGIDYFLPLDICDSYPSLIDTPNSTLGFNNTTTYPRLEFTAQELGYVNR